MSGDARVERETGPWVHLTAPRIEAAQAAAWDPLPSPHDSWMCWGSRDPQHDRLPLLTPPWKRPPMPPSNSTSAAFQASALAESAERGRDHDRGGEPCNTECKKEDEDRFISVWGRRRRIVEAQGVVRHLGVDREVSGP
eukprot:5968756-Prymnesium_polylepis.2